MAGPCCKAPAAHFSNAAAVCPEVALLLVAETYCKACYMELAAAHAVTAKALTACCQLCYFPPQNAQARMEDFDVVVDGGAWVKALAAKGLGIQVEQPSRKVVRPRCCECVGCVHVYRDSSHRAATEHAKVERRGTDHR